MSKKESSAEAQSRRPFQGRLRTVLNAGFLVSTVLAATLAVFYLVIFIAAWQESLLDVTSYVLETLYLILLLASAAGCIAIIIVDHKPQNLERARWLARVTLGITIAALIVDFMLSGLGLIDLVYLFQFGWLIAFQLFTDPNLDRSKNWSNPWAENTPAERKGYIPLNFYNIFWIFVVCSVLGLIVEVIYHAIVFGGYQDRAGMLWGPFSPIYGFGAVLMTVALNRFWDKSKTLIFLVAGAIGAAFEFFVSFFMETAFGIVAWDYSGTFLNIDGRTNFAFFCAWGLLGLVWIKLLLPDVLKLIDAIPLTWRSALTVTMTLFMLFNGVMTLLTLDCWYSREAQQPQDTFIQQFCESEFDDEYMEHRFQSMSIDPDNASRVE